MERDDLIIRRPHPQDGRAQSVRLTPRARGLEGPATAAATAINRELLASLAGDQREDFVTTMQRIVAGAGSPRP